MTDLSTMIAPKSDQLNADDLIAGPRTIKITKVRGCSEPDQPVAVHFEGDDGKPYKPCKSMRRVLVFAWGPNGNDYVGRSVTLYRDEKVMFGGIQVGGIRISHMSHIERDMTMALTATRAKRTPYTVKVLEVPAANRSEISAPTELSDDLKAWVAAMREAATSINAEADLQAWWGEIAVSDEYKALIDASQAEALALKAHVIAHKKALAAQL